MLAKFSKYLIIGALFILWMLFFDTNSWLVHRELNQEITKIEDNKQYYLNQISKDKKLVKKLQDTVELQKFARETYFLKKENEDIFIIEYDSSDTDG